MVSRQKLQNIKKKIMSKNTEYMAVLSQQTNGKFKVKLAKRLKAVNQFRNTWKRVDARELARTINNNSLVIK